MSEIQQPFAVLPPTNREHTETFHGLISVPGAADPVPYTVEIPEVLRSDELAILAPGWGAIKRRSRDFRHALASEQGIMALSYNPARRRSQGSDPLERLVNPQRLHQDTIEAILADIGHNIDSYRSERGEAARSAKVALVPHSMGELSVMRFALDNPGSVASLVRVETVGTEGRLGAKLAKRGVEELICDIAPSIATGRFGTSPTIAWRQMKYFGQDPLRSLGEAISCMSADTRCATEALAATGIYLGYVGGSKDRFFKPQDAIKAIGHLLDHYEVLEIGHVGPQTQASKVAAAVGNMIVNKPSVRL